MSTSGWIFLATVGFLIAIFIYRRSATRRQHGNQAPTATDMQLKRSDDQIPNTHETIEADTAPASEDTTTGPWSEPTPPETNSGPSDSR